MRKAIIITLIFAFVFTNTGLVFAAEKTAQPEPGNQPIQENQVLEPENQQVELLLDGPARDDDVNHESPFHPEVTSLGQGSVKGLSGSFNVDQFSGSASYGYNLELPPGRLGLAPGLNLSYNSHQQNYDSLVGFGWTLSQSYIARSAKEVDKLYTANDFSLVLNGKALELAAIDLIDDTHGQYAAKYEESFLKIEFLENESWLITDKLGQHYSFGTSQENKQDNPDDQSMIYKWLLSEVRDTNDNFISYEYLKREGQIYPLTIKYTGHGEVDGPTEVQFEPFYSEMEDAGERADVHRSYFPHFQVLTEYLVSQVIVLVEGQSERKYQLNYEAGENGVQSLLTSVQRFGYDNEWISLPATTFSYQGQSQEWIDDSENWSNPIISYYFNDRNHPEETRTWGRGPADVNGDGWTDYVISNQGLINPKNSEDWPADYSGIAQYPLDNGHLADVNGDKLPDYIGSFYNQRNHRDETLVKINNPEAQEWQTSGLWTNNLPGNTHPNIMVDLNGDGLADMLQARSRYIGVNINEYWGEIYLNNGDSTWTSAEDWAEHEMFRNENWQVGMFFADVNSDGLADMIKYYGPGRFAPSGIYLNNGNGWSEEPNFQGLPGGAWIYGGSRLTDINNDGLVDVIESYEFEDEMNERVFINNGQGWEVDESWEIPVLFVNHFAGSIYQDLGVRLFDINGDGSSDIVKGYETGDRRGGWSVHLNSSGKSNLLISVNNGYGGVTDIDYQSSARIQNEEEEWQNEKLPFPMQVVASVTVSNGLGDELVTDYKYYGGYYLSFDENPKDSQFGGFHQVVMTQGDKAVSSYYHQGGGVEGSTYGEFEDHLAKKGRVYRQEVYQDIGEGFQLLSQQINKWEVEDLGNDRYFIKSANSISYDFENGEVVQQLGSARAQGVRLQNLNGYNFQPDENLYLKIGEAESLRTYDAKHYFVDITEDGGYKYEMEVHSGPIHYLDEASKFQDIDTTLIDMVDNWQMEKATYHVQLPKELNDYNHLNFYNNNHEVSFTPIDLSWRLNDESLQNIIDNQTSLGQLALTGDFANKQVNYPAVFGQDLDLEVYLTNVALRKDLAIQNLASLGTINPNARDLEVKFELLGNTSLIKLTDLYGIAKELPVSLKSFSELTTDVIELIDYNGQSSYIWPPSALDKNLDKAEVIFRISKENGQLYLTKIIPVNWLETAFYPVRADAVVSYEANRADGNIFQTADTWDQVRNAERGRNVENGENTIEVTSGCGGGHCSINRGFLPFNTSNLPQEAIILNATLEINTTNIFGTPTVNLVQTFQANPESLTSWDYNDVGDVSGGSLFVNTEEPYSLELNEEALNWIMTDDWTKIGFRDEPDFLDDEPGGGAALRFFSSECDNGPVLRIEYTLNHQPNAPTELQAEGQVNPIDVDNQRPEFTAIYNDVNEDDQATHYRLQVVMENTDEEGINPDFNNQELIVWDSGQTALDSPINVGERSEEIEYAAENELALDGRRYYWRIKFWDNDELNNEGEWSEGLDYFEMNGSLTPEAPSDLQTKGYDSPQELVDQTPEFTAVYNDPNLRDQAHWYQLQVSRDENFNDLAWDSDKIELNHFLDNHFRSEDIIYGGQELVYNGATYYWRIKFWDNEGAQGTEGPWSAASTFTMFNQNDLLEDVRIKAVKNHFDTENGNVTQEESLGIVNAADNGIYLDEQGDEKDSTYEYAEPVEQSSYILSAPKEKIVTDPNTEESTAIEMYYDELGYGFVEKANLTKEDLNEPDSIYEKEFNDYGLVVQTVDPLGNTTSISYDENDYYPDRTTNHLNQTTSMEYDLATGQITRTVDPNGLVEERDYDIFGRLIEVRKTNPYSQIGAMLVMQILEYHDDVNPSWVKQTNYPTQSFEQEIYSYFDGLGRTIQIREEAESGFGFRVSGSAYNNEGNLERQSLPYFDGGSDYEAEDWNTPYTEYSYDALDRVTEESVITSENTYTTTYEYDGWNVLTTDANGNQKKLYKDAYGQLIQTDEYLDGEVYSTYYEYNLLGKLIKLTDSQGNFREFTYDSLGRLLSQEAMHIEDAEPEEISIWNFEYDEASNLVRKIDPIGNEILYTYDELNRILTEDFTGQEGVEVQYTYDQGDYGIGRLRRVESEGATTTYYYDKWGRVKQENKTINGRWYSTKWDYNFASLPTKVTYPGNFKVWYSYNLSGLPIRLRIGESWQNIVTSDPIIDDVTYSPLKQMAEIVYHNGTVTENSFDQDQAYRLTHKSTINQLDDILQNLTYTYDDVGNITDLVDASETMLAKTTHYDYDDLYRLTQATVTDSANNDDYQRSYAYDILGNITNKSDIGDYLYQYTHPHQASSINGTQYQYDANGNLTSDGAKTYSYNYNDRLISVIIDENNVLSNLYDQSGQRTQKRLTTETLDTLGNPITFLDTTYYPNKLYEESIWEIEGDPLSQSVTQIRHVSLGNQTIAHINKTSQGEPKLSLVFGDHLGSASILTDSFGRLKTLYDYYPYGGSRQEVENGLHVAAQRYTGQELDEEIGMHYYGARYYEQDIGKFNRIDPVSFKIAMAGEDELKGLTGMKQQKLLENPQVLNNYAYAVNNPVIMKDETGEFAGPFGRDMASGQRSISNFFHSAADYTSSQGGFINKVSGFVTNSVGDFVENVASVFDPDQKSNARVLALALIALDTSTGGEGKALSKVLIKAGDTVSGLKVTKHAAEQFITRNMNLGQIDNALKDGIKYIDTETGNILHTIGEKGRGGYTIVTDQAQKVLVSTENFIRNLKSLTKPDRFKLLK